jgi:hypothetical protein
MLATPASAAMRIPSAPCACAITRRSCRRASSTTARISSAPYCVTPTASPSLSTPPVAHTLITSAPYFTW